jgi:hypothetical protein
VDVACELREVYKRVESAFRPKYRECVRAAS